MNAIRQAFFAAIYKSEPTSLHAMVADRLVKTTPKATRDDQRGLSTNLTFRTYSSLKNQGVLS